MIGPSGTVKVLIATKPVDFRKGAEGLASLVKDQMRADPFSGAVFVFRAKRADRVKLIFWDGTGLCLYAKRLEDGQFRWPKVQDGVMRLTAAGDGVKYGLVADEGPLPTGLTRDPRGCLV